MEKFTVHTIESAPEKSKQTLEALQQRFGFLPNVVATMAANPILLNGFVGLFGSFHSGSFDEAEKQTLLLTNAVTLRCPWTIAAHSTFALEDGISGADVRAMREGRLPQDPKLSALSATSKALLETRGLATGEVVERFTAAGYSQAQIFEVVAGIGISTITATTTNMGETPIDDHFKAQTWSPA